jgi:diaminopimelate decarboxylase
VLFDWAGYGRELAALLDTYPGTVLRIEPGRAVTAYCGWHLTEVIEVKRAYGEWFGVVTGGTHLQLSCKDDDLSAAGGLVSTPLG